MLGWIRIHLPKRWLLLLVFLFLLGDLVDTTVMAVGHPCDRLTVTIAAAQVRVKAVPDGSPLQEDDVVIAVAGVPIDSVHLLRPGFWHRRIRLLEKVHRNEGTPIVVPYTILRDGEERVVRVAWHPYTFGEWMQRVWGLYIAAFVFLLAALLIIWERERTFGSRMMAAMLLMVGWIEINNLMPASSLTLLLDWGWWFIPADILAVMLTVIVVPYTFLVFPRPIRWIEEHHAGLVLLTGAVVVLPVLVIALSSHSSVLQRREAIFAYLNPWLMGVLLFALGRATVQSFRVKEPLERAQWRWMMLGAGIAVLPFLLFYLLPLLLFQAPWLPLTVTSTAVIFFPLSILVASFRYSLVEIDRAVGWILNWVLLFVFAVAVYAPVLRVLRRWWGWLMVERAPVRVEAVVVGIVVLLTLAVEPYVRHGVERLFSREWQSFDAALSEISERLTRVVDYGELQILLEEEVPRRLGLYGAMILSLDDDRHRFRRREGIVELDERSPLVRWMRSTSLPLNVYHLANVPKEAREDMMRLAQEGIEVVVPLLATGRLVALYLLMSRRSANLFTRREMEALGLFSHQLATTMQNADLYRRLQDYNRLLESRVEERTREVETERNRLNAILQNIADGLVVVDTEGRITLVNPAFLRLVGLEEAAVLGHHLLELLPMEALRTLGEETLRRAGEVVTLTMTREDGVTFEASACALQQRGEAEVTGVVIVLRDITRERELDRMKTDFLSTVSHELRTPLTAILGFAKLVLRTLERQIAPLLGEDRQQERRALLRAEDNLHIIIDEGERLTQLINDLLDVSRLEAGKMQWHMEMVDANRIVQQAVSSVHALAEEKGLPIWVRTDESLPPLYADAQRLMQVVINLLSNAIKFTEVGQVVVRLAKVTTDGEGHSDGYALGPHAPSVPAGHWLSIRVEDTGIGIAEEDLQVIFDRFRQAGDVLTDRPQGTGLGLAICREIVLAHHGYIWADSHLGEGSTFHVLLPLERQEPASPR